MNQQVACHTLSEWEGDDIQARLVIQAQRVMIRRNAQLSFFQWGGHGYKTGGTSFPEEQWVAEWQNTRINSLPLDAGARRPGAAFEVWVWDVCVCGNTVARCGTCSGCRCVRVSPVTALRRASVRLARTMR